MFGVSLFVLAVKCSQYNGFFKRLFQLMPLFYAKRKNSDIVSISKFLGGGASSVIGLGRKANKTNGFKTSKSSIYFKIIIKNELQNNALHAKWRAFFYFTEVKQHE